MRRSASGVVLALCCASCHTLRPLDRASINQADLPQRVWVTAPDQATVRLDAPRIEGDTLQGFEGGQFRELVLAPGTVVRAQEPAHAKTAVVVAVASAVTLTSLIYLESRRETGSAQVCLNALDQRPQPFTPCCVGQDTVPC